MEKLTLNQVADLFKTTPGALRQGIDSPRLLERDAFLMPQLEENGDIVFVIGTFSPEKAPELSV